MVILPEDDLAALDSWLTRVQSTMRNHSLVNCYGHVKQVSGTLIAARVPAVGIGELCRISQLTHGGNTLMAEVVGFNGPDALLSPLGPLEGVSTTSRVQPLGRSHEILVGSHLLGRVLNSFGQPLDDHPLIAADNAHWRPVLSPAVKPTDRPRIKEPLVTGVRAIDALLALGRGQRAGLFAGPGCGKTTLLTSIARGAEVDAIVFALVGERGRELREFIDHELDPALVARSVIVCATSDRPAMERARAAFTATAIAEGLSEGGKHVLLLVDSLTRFARAQREIGLAAGEPPGRMGFPPSVYSLLPRLIERAGNVCDGSITALYTVLADGEINSDPISEEVRSLLDGHIVLSRKLSERGHYPAIDCLASLSRTMANVTDGPHRQTARKFRALLAKYQELELLIQLGEYQTGTDAFADEAIAAHPALIQFLQQGQTEYSEWGETLENMQQLVNRL